MKPTGVDRAEHDPAASHARRPHRRRWGTALVCAGWVWLALAGCASLPAPVDRPHSGSIIGADGSPLARLVDAATPRDQRALSGIRLLADGADAWATRLALIRRATHSLDLQAYQIEDDRSGRQLLHELRRAADRGVRVRLLVDDLLAAGQDAQFSALDAHPHAEVRFFNPLTTRNASPAVRVLMSLDRFGAINRRMHNKLLVADGLLALTGGRNIGDAYFRRGADSNFIDLDVLATGAVVQELNSLFDMFWNDDLAFPVRSLVRSVEWVDAPRSEPEADLGQLGSIASEIDAGRLLLHFAPVRLIADTPGKAALTAVPDRPGDAMAQALQLMRAASSEVSIASPYFVPGPVGLALIREASGRGIRLAVLTNSIGATDEPLVHLGYTHYRLEMLKLGVSLGELSPVQGRGEAAPVGSASSLSRLHAKLAVVDGRWLLVGSMNMDRRSSRLNTEIALAIDDRVLAAEAQALLRRWERSQYQLRLASAQGPIEWVSQGADGPVVHAAEPHAERVWSVPLRLLSTLVPEELL